MRQGNVDGSKRVTRGLLCCGAAAGPLFVSVFVIEGRRRPDYEPLRHPVSSLSLGPRGWTQIANFAATGMLYLAGAIGFARVSDPTGSSRLGAAILSSTGVGLLGAAVFSTDPVSGYPPGTPDAPGVNTVKGKMHNVAALPVFLGIPVGAFAYAWRFHRCGRQAWAYYSGLSGGLMLMSMGLAGAGFGQKRGLVRSAGFFQRIAIVAGIGWLTALALRACRNVGI